MEEYNADRERITALEVDVKEHVGSHLPVRVHNPVSQGRVLHDAEAFMECHISEIKSFLAQVKKKLPLPKKFSQRGSVRKVALCERVLRRWFAHLTLPPSLPLSLFSPFPWPCSCWSTRWV